MLEYYHVSRVLHFEVLCRALGYDPNLLMFRRFFRLAKNGDWFTFETYQVDVCLICPLVSTLGSWKDRFFWLDPFESKLNEGMLKALRACPSRLRPFPEHLLVFIGVSVLCDKPNRDPSFMSDQDDTSDVVLRDAEAIEGEDAIARTAEGRLVLGGKYVNVPNVKGFTKASSSKPSTRRSSRRLKGPGQSSGTEVEGKKELAVVAGKKGSQVVKKLWCLLLRRRVVKNQWRGMLRMSMFLTGRSRLGITSSPPLFVKMCDVQ
ncbi:hypothetical protein HanIR_Chr14g0694341 [Helianthus annuus]|nr:hypothetical protein HanIR_Chr14g0694341 [Helianthus annuus]KAJ0485413.1 hypothetical protein HanHA89_Chr14g0568021 [Helianthus annuus]